MTQPNWQQIVEAQGQRIQTMLLTMGEQAATIGDLRRALDETSAKLAQTQQALAEATKPEEAPEATEEG